MSEKAFLWHVLLVLPYFTVTTFLAVQHLAEHWH